MGENVFEDHRYWDISFEVDRKIGLFRDVWCVINRCPGVFAGQSRIAMNKTKKTKAKAPAQAKVITENAQPIATKGIVKQVAKAKATAASARASDVAKSAGTAKAVTVPAEPGVRLEFSQPGAHSVAVAGSFNSWQPEQANATANGTWIKELTIGPGRYEYMFVVDGKWMADPNAKEYMPNPFGGQNSVLVINS